VGGVVVVMHVALCTQYSLSPGFNFCCLLVERRILMKHGRMYKCVPRSQKRHVSVDRRCNLNRAKISYNDVTQCVGHVMGVSKAGSSEPETHCDFFVPNKARAM